ncbi:ROK family protein [Kineococcus arenarius]|uniref:ROK family protein n=1 Tax=unclassified Kineococcus TaxID=2621656 RepID=UPI003D7DF007
MPGPTDLGDVRRRNLSLVLRTLDAHAPCARSDIRAATGLVNGTVASLVDDLVARGLVAELGTSADGGRGRPRRLLRVLPDRALSVAVRLTPHLVVGEVRRFDGSQVWEEHQEHAVRRGHGQDVVDALAGALGRATAVATAHPAGWVAQTVVAVPAPVVAGTAIGAAIEFGLGRTELHEALRPLASPTGDLVIRNDGRLGALAEHAAIAPEERPRTMAYVVGGLGVGGGLVVDGELFLGAHAMAGECGHISVDARGPECDCGARGCLALYLGLPALLSGAGLTGHAERSGHDAALDELVRRLQRQDPTAHESVDRAGAALAAAIGTMSNYTDLDLVVLGGTLPRLYPWLQPHVDRLVRSRARRITEFNPRTALARHGEEAPLRGAWLLARRSVLQDPDRVPLLDRGDRPG